MVVKSKTKSVSKGKGASGRRSEKRHKRFAPEHAGPAKAKANVLRDDAPPRKRPRDDAPADTSALPARKAYKQGAFVRPERAKPPQHPRPAEPVAPLSRKALKLAVEARKAASKPNHALVTARGARRLTRVAASRPPPAQELTSRWEKLRKLSITPAERTKLTARAVVSNRLRRSLTHAHNSPRCLPSWPAAPRRWPPTTSPAGCCRAC